MGFLGTPKKAGSHLHIDESFNNKNLMKKISFYIREDFRLWCLVTFSLMLLSGCRKAESEMYIPQAPDYSDPTFWYTEENDKTGQNADVFYIVSTWEKDWATEDGVTVHYADVYNKQHRDDMTKEISGVAAYMGKDNNFYAPFYRHITIEGWATRDENIINSRFEVAFEDVRNAFEAFLKNRPKDRPFVLAGFSQGGKAVVELLKIMPEEAYRRLVAAYVLGYKVTPADTLASAHIKAAQGPDDIGVTICYNSVSDVKYIQPVVAAPCAFCINPVNWRTDEVPATLHDTITVSVAQKEKVLVVKGYSGSEYAPIMGFLNVGDFHSCEPWLYKECLEKNIKNRIKVFKRTRL